MATPSEFSEYVDRWLDGSDSPPPIVELLGIRLLGYGNGEGRAELAAGRKHHNAMGRVHGGVLCDLADVAFGAAVTSVIGPGEAFLTINLHIDFLGGTDESLLTATARVLRRTRALVFCTCRIDDERGQQVAQLSSTCRIQRQKQENGD